MPLALTTPNGESLQIIALKCRINQK